MDSMDSLGHALLPLSLSEVGNDVVEEKSHEEKSDNTASTSPAVQDTCDHNW